MDLRERLVSQWYAPRLTPAAILLLPLAWIFTGAAALRRALYRCGLLGRDRLPVPVVVVGNITVGGTGKSPVVLALARGLAARGFHPGIVSRGYRRRDPAAVRVVTPDDTAASVGDEPLMMARSGIPVAVGTARAAAARHLLAAHPECDVLIADDGLQHYALARDVEVAVVDGTRGLGNRRRLPAGPLREGLARLSEVDVVLVHRGPEGAAAFVPDGAFEFALEGEVFRHVRDPGRRCTAGEFAGMCVHAIAGIGHPARFFATLRRLGLAPVEHPFPDHHSFGAADLRCPGAEAILMTEKDAVKCGSFADERCWYLPVHAELGPAVVDRILARLARVRNPRPGREGRAG